MAGDPSSTPPPPSPPTPPTPPGAGASRDEWRAWRHAQRDYMRAQMRGPFYGPWSWGPWPSWGGGWFWGAALIGLGVYFLLSNLGLLSWLRGEILWPILVILVGVALLFNRARRWR